MEDLLTLKTVLFLLSHAFLLTVVSYTLAVYLFASLCFVFMMLIVFSTDSPEKKRQNKKESRNPL